MRSENGFGMNWDLGRDFCIRFYMIRDRIVLTFFFVGYNLEFGIEVLSGNSHAQAEAEDERVIFGSTRIRPLWKRSSDY